MLLFLFWYSFILKSILSEMSLASLSYHFHSHEVSISIPSLSVCVLTSPEVSLSHGAYWNVLFFYKVSICLLVGAFSPMIMVCTSLPFYYLFSRFFFFFLVVILYSFLLFVSTVVVWISFVLCLGSFFLVFVLSVVVFYLWLPYMLVNM